MPWAGFRALIAAPPSIKNREGKRDPEMHQTKKGNPWYLELKVHVGADSKSCLIHSASVTAANVGDAVKSRSRRSSA